MGLGLLFLHADEALVYSLDSVDDEQDDEQGQQGHEPEKEGLEKQDARLVEKQGGGHRDGRNRERIRPPGQIECRPIKHLGLSN